MTLFKIPSLVIAMLPRGAGIAFAGTMNIVLSGYGISFERKEPCSRSIRMDA